jgi:hypothetical protein
MKPPNTALQKKAIKNIMEAMHCTQLEGFKLYCLCLEEIVTRDLNHYVFLANPQMCKETLCKVVERHGRKGVEAILKDPNYFLDFNMVELLKRKNLPARMPTLKQRRSDFTGQYPEARRPADKEFSPDFFD